MRVLIAAPSGIDLLQLRRVLGELDAEVLTSTASDGPNDSAVADPWSAADAAIAVFMGLEEGRILLEAGIAIGRSIPLLVLAEHPVSSAFPTGAKVVEMSGLLLNGDALRFQLGLFLKSLTGTPGSSGQQTSQTHALDLVPFRARLAEIRSSSGADRALRLEEWVAGLFEAAGASIATPSDRQARGFDFVASVPETDSSISPLLVEVKVARSPRMIESTAHNLQYVVIQERAGIGLLIYDAKPPSEAYELQTVPMVILMSVDGLMRSLEGSSISSVITKARDEAVHRL
jgi:hypothetical protein